MASTMSTALVVTPEDLICKDLGTVDDEKITRLLVTLAFGFESGRMVPNANCFKTLMAIATRSLPEFATATAVGKELRISIAVAKSILDNHFYAYPNFPVSWLDAVEDKEEIKVQDDSEDGSHNDDDEKWEQRTLSKAPLDYLPAEIAAPFLGSPGLASLVSGYYSNCALLTMDGAKCGLGNRGGFQYRYPTSVASIPTAGAEESYCARECATDLCPGWLSSLLARAPTKVIIEYTHPVIGDNRVFKAKVATVDLRIKATSWIVNFRNGLPINLLPETIAAGCRLLGSQRRTIKIANQLEIDIYLDKRDPEYWTHFISFRDNKRMRVNFPEFPDGYFVDSDLWTYSKDINGLIGTLTIPNQEEYEKMRDEQLALRKMERYIATQSLLRSSSSSSPLYALGKRSLPVNFGGGEAEPDENPRTHLAKTGRFSRQ